MTTNNMTSNNSIYTMSSVSVKTWIKTDDGQMVMKIRDNLWIVAQIRNWFDDYCVSINLVDIEAYDKEDIAGISGYFGYDGTEELTEQIIAEMLAEDIDDFQADYKGTYEECEDWMEEVLPEYCKEVYGNIK